MTTLRAARADDYDAIAAVVDAWWERPVLKILPRLFLDHFHPTSLIVEAAGHGADSVPELRGFLIGFPSVGEPDQAYIHFVGVSPSSRGEGLGRTLYESFFSLARGWGRTTVRSITSPFNHGSIAFHRAMRFTVTGPVIDYNGPGTEYMTFERRIDTPAST
jgi:ribosomal protein S18 acetylase RimI-like enzyme